MKILVTGGAGFIGSHLVERLLHEGHNVRVLDNFSTGKRDNLPSDQQLELVEGDIRHSDTTMAAAAGMDGIFHLAAVASVQASVDDPVGTHQSNLVGTLNLLEAARRNGVRRFLYASSAAVYGETEKLPITEDAPLCPLTPYAVDKLAGEYYLAFYGRKYELGGTAFRFFNVYGPRQDPSSPYSGVISIFVDRAMTGRPITIFGDGQQTRDFVYVTDLAEFLCASLHNERTIGKVLNVGCGVECSLETLITSLERLTGKSIERHYAAPRTGDIRRSCADVSQLKALHGRSPATAIHEGLASLLRAGR